MNAPLVPANVDLRDFPYMPLDVVRLRDSSVVVLSTAEEFRCAVLLWCTSWHQIPAASLPDDDLQLSQFAGFGRVVRDWKKVRTGALRGWIKCDDGRLYHPVVAEKACEAWEQRLGQRFRTECSRIKKAAQRAEASPVYPTPEQWRSHFETTGREQWCPSTVPNPVPPSGGGVSPGTTTNVPREMTSKGREGKVIEEQEQSSLRSDLSEVELRTASAEPLKLVEQPPPASLDAKRAEREQRLAQVTDDAMAAYNLAMAKPAGLLSRVLNVGRESRQRDVKRVIKIAREICKVQYGNPTITPQFWADFFGLCASDPFLNGTGPYTNGHENWMPGFEYLTKPTTMLKVYERSEPEAEDDAA